MRTSRSGITKSVTMLGADPVSAKALAGQWTPQPVNGDFHSSVAHIQLRRDFLIGLSLGVHREINPQRLKHLTLARCRTFFAKLAHHALQKRQSPAAIKHPFRGLVVAGFEQFPLLGLQVVPGNKHVPAAAFQRMGLVPFVIQKVLQRDKQEGPEASFGRGDRSQSAFLQKMREERLSQVLRLMERMARKNGWFVPVTPLLDFLAERQGVAVLNDRTRATLERRWLWEKLFRGTS